MPTVAEQLRTARERQKLSIEDVVEMTKLRRDHVRALESGDYSQFFAPVYIRGFTRSYAAILKLDTARLLAALQKELNQKGIANAEDYDRMQPKGIIEILALYLSRINWKIAAAALLLLFLLVAGSLGTRFWRYQQTRDPLAGLGKGEYAGEQTLPIERLPLPPLLDSLTNQP